MIRINGNEYSGSIVRNDENTVVATILTLSTLPDLCSTLTNVSEIEETLIDGTKKTYVVNRASDISSNGDYVFIVTFQKHKPKIEELDEAIDKLLVMLLRD